MSEHLASGSGDKQHALKLRRDDLYETPTEAVNALLKAERLPDVIWEPACGRGAIARVLRGVGKQVYATDLVDYHSSDQDCFGWDFLMEQQLPLGVQAIITNPPYKLADEFVRHALKLCPQVIMLLRLAFLESVGRSDLLDAGQLAHVHVFKNRLPMMHRDGWDGKKSTNTMAFAWFCWHRNWCGPTIIDRISWN